MSRFALPAALLLAAAPAAAQVCQGYPSVAARWKVRDQLTLQAYSELSSLTGVHEHRASTGLVFEVPVKRFSACAFAGLEHRYTWFDADAAATLSSFGTDPFSGGDWYLPVGLAFGYSWPIKEDVSVFAYSQPHYMLFRSSSAALVAPLRLRPDDVLQKGRFGVRSGVGIRAGQAVLRLENLYSSAPGSSSLRLGYMRSKSPAITAPIPR